jgi:hemerythrin-like domain-containing protein
MNAVEALPALNTVEQDHRLVLDRMRALKETVGYLADAAGADPRKGLPRLRELQDYFAKQFKLHMEEEETTLFPLLEGRTREGHELVAHLRKEHAEIRRLSEELGSCLEVASELEERLPRAVLRDVLHYGWALWELLDSHAHAETRAVHKFIAQTFADAD